MDGSLSSYVEDLRERLQNACDLAAVSAQNRQSKQKEQYDSRVRGAVLNTGDRVLVKIVAFDGKQKLSNKWEEEPYLVTQQPNPDIPVFVVKKESGKGREHICIGMFYFTLDGFHWRSVGNLILHQRKENKFFDPEADWQMVPIWIWCPVMNLLPMKRI